MARQQMKRHCSFILDQKKCPSGLEVSIVPVGLLQLYRAIQYPPKLGRTYFLQVVAGLGIIQTCLSNLAASIPKYVDYGQLDERSLLTSSPSILTTLTPSFSRPFVHSDHVAASTALVPSSTTYVVNPSLAASTAVDLTQ